MNKRAKVVKWKKVRRGCYQNFNFVDSNQFFVKKEHIDNKSIDYDFLRGKINQYKVRMEILNMGLLMLILFIVFRNQNKMYQMRAIRDFVDGQNAHMTRKAGDVFIVKHNRAYQLLDNHVAVIEDASWR